MEYNKYSYLWPPRPEKAIPETMIGFYERKGWIGQIKKNGTCNLVFISPEGEVIYKNRHEQDHKAWTAPSFVTEYFAQFAKHGWCVFVTELMHSKVPGIRDTIYIHDILVYENEHLTGTTFADRQELLYKVVEHTDDGTHSHYIVNDFIWLAKNHTGDFADIWAKMEKDDEGFVFKNPKGRLVVCTKKSANAAWQIKCRVPHKNYGF